MKGYIASIVVIIFLLVSCAPYRFNGGMEGEDGQGEGTGVVYPDSTWQCAGKTPQRCKEPTTGEAG